jgi:hypothetical protein
MRAMPDTRLEDLGPRDYVAVQCLSCDHSHLLTADRLKSADVKYDETIADLVGRFRCRQCDRKGRVDVTIRWATVNASRRCPRDAPSSIA